MHGVLEIIMSIKNYLIIEQNEVTNIVLWDGNVQTWSPSGDVLVLSQEDTPTKIWQLISDDYQLVDSIGDALIGFKYDGARCIINLPKPEALGNPPNA